MIRIFIPQTSTKKVTNSGHHKIIMDSYNLQQFNVLQEILWLKAL